MTPRPVNPPLVPGESAAEHLRNAQAILGLLVVDPALAPELVADVAAARDRVRAALEKVEAAAESLVVLGAYSGGPGFRARDIRRLLVFVPEVR